MSIFEQADVPPEAPLPAQRARWHRLRLALGAVALVAFSFWLGARLGPLTAFSGGDGLTQGTWLPAPAPARAYIGGAVAHSGLYRLAPDTRLAGLLAQAGGPTRNADLAHVNLAAPVHDGTTIIVPRRHGRACER